MISLGPVVCAEIVVDWIGFFGGKSSKTLIGWVCGEDLLPDELVADWLDWSGGNSVVGWVARWRRVSARGGTRSGSTLWGKSC